ncbi:FAM10 family protein [Spatholobus suberectus]|nr:FAM10 family protein [Spatholobus suberectus]
MVSKEASLFLGLFAMIALTPLVVAARDLPKTSSISRTSNGGGCANCLIGRGLPSFGVPGFGGVPWFDGVPRFGGGLLGSNVIRIGLIVNLVRVLDHWLNRDGKWMAESDSFTYERDRILEHVIVQWNCGPN